MAQNKVEFCPLEKCFIKTVDSKIIKEKPYKIPQALEEKALKYILDMEKRGVIRKSNSEWRNPVRFLQKENGDLRFVMNLMKLNDIVEKDAQGLNNIKDILQATSGSRIFSVIDLKEAFYSIEINEEDKHKTAFEIKGITYESNSMVMGFKNSPQIMQRVMTRILIDHLGKGVEVYIDDIVIHAKTVEEHDKILIEVIDLLVKNKLRINFDKAQIGQNSIKLLGVTINGFEIKPIDKQKEEIKLAKEPRNIKDLRKFLGKINWFRGYIQNMASKTYYLTNSLKGKKGNRLEIDDRMRKEFKE